MIKIKGLNKIFHTKDQEFQALDNINLTFNDGEFIAILGESGSGKSTLLNMLSGIDSYSDGEIIIDQVNTKNFDDTKWRKFRNKNIGFVFQRYNLVEHLTSRENVGLPLMFTGEKKRVIESKVKKILEQVGLSEHANTCTSSLSGGEKQRIAIARSILTKPHILLCDEPTGALDSSSSSVIMDLIKGYATGNQIVIMVTHDERLAQDYADRIIRIHDGAIISDEYVKENYKKAEQVEEEKNISGKKKFNKIVKDYKNVNRRFIRFLAKENFKQNKAANLKIISSFILGLSILFIINLILSNVIIHNKAMFERNNDFKKFYVSDYDDESLNQIKQNPEISEVGMENRYFIEHSYLQYNDTSFVSNYIETINNVNNISLETIPDKAENFYLTDQILFQADNLNVDNGVYVSSELIYNHYLNKSMEKDNYNNYEKDLSSLFKDYPLKSFINKSIFICGDSDVEVCHELKIIGILDSNYNGVNYAGKILVKQAGFQSFLSYLQDDLKYQTVDGLYKSTPYLYFNNLETYNSKSLEDQYNVKISNAKIEDYQQVLILEKFANYIIYFIMGAIFIIFGTVIINIISFNIDARTKDIGVYTSIGVSKVTIRRMFIYETIKVLKILVVLLSAVYGLILLIFNQFYTSIITYNKNLIEQFGRIDNISYELDDFLYIIVVTILLYLISVYLPAFKVSRKKAIDTLSW